MIITVLMASDPPLRLQDCSPEPRPRGALWRWSVSPIRGEHWGVWGASALFDQKVRRWPRPVNRNGDFKKAQEQTSLICDHI